MAMPHRADLVQAVTDGMMHNHHVMVVLTIRGQARIGGGKGGDRKGAEDKRFHGRCSDWDGAGGCRLPVHQRTDR